MKASSYWLTFTVFLLIFFIVLIPAGQIGVPGRNRYATIVYFAALTYSVFGGVSIFLVRKMGLKIFYTATTLLAVVFFLKNTM